MGSIVRLENWSLTQASPYLPAEYAVNCLQGKAYGHPDYKDGAQIRSSVIAKVEGRIITTKTGTVYELGEIDPLYLKWMEENDILYDPENPIKTIRSPEESVMYKKGTVIWN